MTPSDAPVAVEVLDPPARAAVGEAVTVGLVIRRPAVAAGPAELRQVDRRPDAPVDLDADLFERDVAVGPGEVYRCAIRVTFTRPGPADLSAVYVQADAGETRNRGALVWLPSCRVQVVPSLNREVAVAVSRVCGYELGTKLEVELTHNGGTRFTDFRVTVGPAEWVRAGVSERRRPAFGPGDVLRFDAVVAGPEVELELDATAGDEPVGPSRQSFPSPAVGGEAAAERFRFLEPRRLTTDRVAVYSKADGRAVPVSGGAFPVTGGGGEYLAVIHPSHPQAVKVVLHDEVGKVGVTDPRRLDDGGWEFPLNVAADPYLTQSVRLYYDVETPGRVLRGELYLSVRPTWRRHLLFAATLGVAVTVKGATAVGSALLSPDGVWEDAPGAIERLRPLDWLYLSSIPGALLVMRVADVLTRRFQDE